MPKLSEFDLRQFGHDFQAIGTLYVGKDRALLAIVPEEQGDIPPIERLDMSLGEWQQLLLQTDMLETEVSARQGDGTIVKAILRKSARQISQGVSWAVFRRDGYACRYCAKNDLPLTVDHVVCWEVGGPSTEQNLVAACKKCNRTRGSLPYEEWLKHPYYLKVSRALSPSVIAQNEALVQALPQIPRLDHIKTHR